jgi:alpha-methylacyl-CoA racemase
VLDVGEAPSHHHNVSRGVFRTVNGVVQPSPAPRFSHTPSPATGVPPARGSDARSVLAECGLSVDEIENAIADGAVRIAA